MTHIHWYSKWTLQGLRNLNADELVWEGYAAPFKCVILFFESRCRCGLLQVKHVRSTPVELYGPLNKAVCIAKKST